ncbi:MAG TPA: energy transducer TonB [Bacteroidales bacterium]|nr:energy transducer TonB [Bacteroidales bacterium]
MFDNLRHVLDFDDLLFEKRNKDYGAYQLRKKYNAVVFGSVIIASLIVSALVVIPFVISRHNDLVLGGGGRYVSVNMDHFEPPADQVYVPPAPPPPGAKKPQDIVKYVAPEIVDSIKPIEKLLPTADEALEQTDVDIKEVPGSGAGDNIIPGEGGEGSDQPFFFVEVMPSFRGGGINKFRQWIQMRTIYPQEAIIKKIKGSVYLTFIVEKDGSVSHVTVVKGVDPLIDNEAVKVIESSPRWTPGLQRGHPVRVRYSIKLNFSF